VFTSGGTYLGITAQTDDQGEVAFDLSDGDYRFRADYLGYQFWTDVVTLPTTLSDILTIPHQDVTVTVNEVYGAESDPLEGVNVYLFTATGSYMSRYLVTNSLGQVTFNLPQENYKVRADYLSGQFWSDVFVWQDVDVDIDHGIVDVHVTFNGEDVIDAPVYLFTASGTYLGGYENTDAYGHASFLVPAQSYKFRVDYDSTQYWSDVISVIVHEETDVEMPLDQLALNKTNDPNPVRFDGKPPVFKPEGIKVASIGSLAGILSQSIIANTTPPKVYYYLNDHLGTPQIMTDENRPFGEAVVHPYSTVENNVRLPGQYYDEETGLHYNYHRYYDPRTGRYLRPDPSHSIQPKGCGIPYLVPNLLNKPQDLNNYAYVENNPINHDDSIGLSRFKWLPTSGCEYYKKICDSCKNGKCESGIDKYACKAYDCCKAFGNSPGADCIRGCLIAFDKRNCAHLNGEARNRCRRLAHWDCYDRCLGHVFAARGLLVGLPPECKDAMEEVGGMGF